MHRLLLIVSLTAACQRAEEKPRPTPTTGSAGSAATTTNAAALAAKAEQVTPPLDLETPPLDAIKTASGLVYKKLVTVEEGLAPKRNDTVMINYTGWRQTTGETFFTNRGRGQPMPLPLANTAPGFTEAMQLLKKGEKAMLWLPPSIGYRGGPPPGSQPETLVYEVEVLDINEAPPIPADVGVPPPNAQTLPSGVKYVVVQQGPGKEKARYYDTVTFNYTAWDTTGRMFDTTEMRKRPATVPPFRQTPAMEELLTSMTAGSRARFWIPAERMQTSGKPIAGMPEGILTYEVELLTITRNNPPWPVPADVAAPPANAKKTEKGIAYKVLKAGKGGAKPTPSDTVKVQYTGWTTDGRMFDSSVIKGEPAEFSLQGVMVGWTDALQVMSAGDRMRFWIPDELAYKGSPGKPQGMLVFDIELVEIKPPPAEAQPAEKPAPPDVAAPPADAKKSPRGAFYKILDARPDAPKPKMTDRVKLHYAGWTTDGKWFDGSRGEPAEFTLQTVLPGWTDALPLIGVGEKARLWIPEELAFKGGGGPQGMLVFDVELVEIRPQ